MKVLTIIGARPQFVKAAVVSRAIDGYNKNCGESQIREVLVHTGQHYDANMSDVFFVEMKIPLPDYHLGIGGGTHGAMTGKMLEKLETVMLHEKPDVVLVYGDTNSTLAGALAAVKLHIPVAHVEAGLRSFNMRMPEEVNRILTDRISQVLFCPTETAMRNLEREGIRIAPTNVANATLNALNGATNAPLANAKAAQGEALAANAAGRNVAAETEKSVPVVLNVGDVMYDAALFYQKIAKPSLKTADLLKRLSGGFYLATVHRAENTDDSTRLANIMQALDDISSRTPVVLPLHPRTRKLLVKQGITLSKIKLINPVGYFDMLTLLAICKGVFTDSGGVQKEAYFFRKPCVTLRDETEWVELVENGFNTLVGAQPDKILFAEQALQRDSSNFSKELYGTGQAGELIVKELVHYFR
ncbi:MAG: UDP-N-acetyl glucosamine 2-epimerase [Desulfosporosinus sp.]